MINKTIVCLANSRKLHGRCIAGQEIIDGSPGAWIRPVSNRQSQEVSENERQYQDGSDPKVLDIIDIPLINHSPGEHQPENWLLDPLVYWSKVDKFSWGDLELFSESEGALWRNEFHTYNGINDKIPLDEAKKETSSLKLIHVDDMNLKVFAPGEAFGNSKRRVQGQFHFSGTEYALWVTDPDIERSYLARTDGDYKLNECYLTISLGEPYDGYCYKLVAAIIQRP